MKKLIAIILAIFMFCCLTACADSTTAFAEEAIERHGFVVVRQLYVYGDTSVYIVYDPSTMVEYIIYDGYRSYSICPYYDENGNVAFYKGD